MTHPILEVRALRKHYPLSHNPFGGAARRAVKAVDGIDLTVNTGETLGLIGESGCGKSTTAKLLLRLEPVTSGEILFDGAPVQESRGAQLRSYRHDVQAVFQDPYSSLSPRRRVRDAIAEPMIAAKRYTKKDIADRVSELLDIVGLSADAADRLPHEFSGGQRQRIAIARGLALQPRLLILDEPVSALDVSIRAQILNLLQDLQQQFGLSYLLISHDLEIVSHMCSNVAVMYLGHIVESGRARDVQAAPQHPYTQALYSSVLPAHPDHQRTRIKLHGPLPSPIDPPSGCVFRTRCRLAQPICAAKAPPPIRTGAGPVAACHFVEPAASTS